jgi:transposase, IS5 family
VRQLVYQLIQTGAQQPAKLHLEQPLDLELCFLDTTCVAAHIHYPVDWVLLRDATRTLMKALTLIREQGLKHRMEPPERFISRMNRLCMEMNHARSKPSTGRNAKSVFRKIDRLVGTVRNHAKRYRDLLDKDWKQTQWTRSQAEQVLRRIDQVLDLLPKARKQAGQRIVSGQAVESKDKLLSLYEPEARVIVRHKAGAEVEFGNTLLIGETLQGVILDWHLFEESAPADARLVVGSLNRIEKAFGQVPKALGSDRGFDSQSNRSVLQKRQIYNALCPREPQELKKRNRSWKFKRLQKRRGQIEPRIAILKNNFLGQPLRSKGFRRRNLSLSWAILTHNLWVIARLVQAEMAQTQRLAA